MTTTTEIKQNREAWVAALRSGQYQQTTRATRREDEDGTPSYCPFGVACEISGLGFWTQHKHSDAYDYRTEDNPSNLVPHPVVSKFLGLSDDKDSSRFIGKIMRLNDEAGATFDELAPIIEEYFS